MAVRGRRSYWVVLQHYIAKGFFVCICITLYTNTDLRVGKLRFSSLLTYVQTYSRNLHTDHFYN